MGKALYFIIVISLTPVSVFSHVNTRVFKNISSDVVDHFEKHPESLDEFLNRIGLNRNSNSIPTEVLNNIESTSGNPMILLNDYNLSLRDIIQSDIYKAFFFESLDLSNTQQMEELFSYLIPGIRSLGDTNYSENSVGFYKKVFSSELWDDFITALEEFNFSGSSGFTKVDIEATLLTHLGYSSYHTFLLKQDLYFSYNSVYSRSPWTPNDIPPTEFFIRQAMQSGTKPSDILMNPHFQLDPNHPTFQNLIKVILSDFSRINENINSKEIVLKMWHSFKVSLLSGETSQKTFKKYILRKLNQRESKDAKNIVTAIQKNPFLSAVFEAAKENATLARMLENILSFNLKSSVTPEEVNFTF